MTKATLSPADLHLEVLGPETGTPVLLLHGWGSSAALMHPIAEALADTYRVYNPDLPGHGRSPDPPTGWGVPEYAALVHRLIMETIGQPVPLVGHSNGGRIGLYMATTDPYREDFRKFILVSPSGITPQRSAGYYIRKTLATALKAPFQLLPSRLRTFGLDWLRHSLVWRMLGSSDYQTLSGVMRETFVKTVNCYLDHQIQHVALPTLLFWGDQDTAISRYQMEVLAQGIPDAGLVVLEQAGHYGHLDAPDTFYAATRHFLEHA